MHLRTCLFIVAVTAVYGQTKKKSGEEIADALYKHPKECKDPDDGGIWAPLAPGHTCGSHDCNYPDQWCSAKSGNGPSPTLSCVKLSEECKKALLKDDGKATDAPKASTRTTKIFKSTQSTKPNKTHGPASKTSRTTASSSSEVTTPGAPADEPTEPTTVEEIETTTAAESEEEETTVATRRPKPNKLPPSEAFPRRNRPVGNAGGAAAAVAAAPAPADDCKDSSQYCCFWAGTLRGGTSECNSNALWMRTNCQKSCGTCGCKPSNYLTCQVNINIEGCPHFRNNPLTVPVNRGGGVFAFPVARANSPLLVPVGAAGGGGGGTFLRGGPVPAVPVANFAFLPPQPVGPGQVVIAAGRRRR